MSDSFVAMIVLDASAKFSTGDVVARLRADYPAMAVDIAALSEPGKPGEPAIVKVGATSIMIMPVDKPMPPHALDRAMAGDFLWKDAAKDLGRQRAHIIVSHLEKPTDIGGRLAVATDLVRACGSLAALTSAIGVSWVAAEAVYTRDWFCKVAAASATEVPIDVLIRHHLYGEGQPGRQLLGNYTGGLASFLGREIEFRPASLPPQTVIQRVRGTALYLLSKGMVLKHGDTLGISESERIKVEHLPGGGPRKVPVIRLTYEKAGA